MKTAGGQEDVDFAGCADRIDVLNVGFLSGCGDALTFFAYSGEFNYLPLHLPWKVEPPIVGIKEVPYATA